MARYDIHHRTTYHYSFPVAVSHHSARLKPLRDVSQSCQSFSLKLQPESVDLVERVDYFGNLVHKFSIQESHNDLIVDARSEVHVFQSATDLDSIDTLCGSISDALNDFDRVDFIDAKQFLYPTESTPKTEDIEAFGRRFLGRKLPFGRAVLDMLDAFAEEFAFDATATEISTPVEQVLADRKGVCQDFAHMMIAGLRSCGLAARYVSGYVLTQPPEGQKRLAGADASHAWVSVFHPELGWIDIDPTNRLACGDQHIKVAYGRDYFDVSMIAGAVTGGGDHTLAVEVTVQPMR